MNVSDGLRGRAKGYIGGDAASSSGSSSNSKSNSDSMPPPSRTWPGDVELGKRRDDYKPAPSNAHPWSWAWAPAVRWRRRRILLGLLATFLIWLFIHNIPTDLGSIDQRMGRPLRPGRVVDGVQFGYVPPPHKEAPLKEATPHTVPSKPQASKPQAPVGPPPKTDEDITDAKDHYYNGPISFYDLAGSLHGIARTNGQRPTNRNVLFAASSLKSASNLMPMVCEMARRQRNFVHLILLGRDNLPMDELLEMNGIDRNDCKAFFHDARPDYSEYSSDSRAETAIVGAIRHTNNLMHPQVIITDDSVDEDAFFVKAIRAQGKELDRPVIEIPSGKYEDFLWITYLDSSSLASWHRPAVDVLVHAQPDSSGSLLRMLESLKSADYAGLVPPQITVDLPADIEPFARNYLRDMEWPPKGSTKKPNTIRIHHRLSTEKATTESNTVRFLEAFYPKVPDDSHVLLLSAQTELSPLYFHYLMFHLLEYRYSSFAPQNSGNLFGIALAAPQNYLNGTAPFVAPSMTDMFAGDYNNLAEDNKDSDTNSPAPFLWQAPNADAALIFGDKWAEIHDYVKNRLRAIHSPASVYTIPSKPVKLVAENQPGWMEYMLELIRARGWTTLFPAQDEAGGWATVHQDLYQPPEEFMRKKKTANRVSPADSEPIVGGAGPGEEEEEHFISAPLTVPSEQLKEKRITITHSQPLHSLLSFDSYGRLPELSHMPSLNHAGQTFTAFERSNELTEYKEWLRQAIGGCTVALAGEMRTATAGGKTDDLFCFVDTDPDREFFDDADDEEVSPEKEEDEDEDDGMDTGYLAEKSRLKAEGEQQVKAPKKSVKTPPGQADVNAEQSKAAPAPETVAERPVQNLDSTAKQKAAYAKQFGNSNPPPPEEVDEPASAAPVPPPPIPAPDSAAQIDTMAAGQMEVEDQPVRKGVMKAIVEDLGPPVPKEG